MSPVVIVLAAWFGLDALFLPWLVVVRELGLRRRRMNAMYGKAPANVRALRGHETRRG